MKEFRLNPLSDCETLIMICVWESDQAVSVKQLQEQLLRFGKDYKETTIYTIIKNLENKGYLSREKRGASYYTPVISKKDFLRQYLGNIQAAFGMSIPEMLEKIENMD